MNARFGSLAAVILAAACAAPGLGTRNPVFHADWSRVPDRTWIGPDFWANRLQDWRLRGGRVECAQGARRRPIRTLQLLTHSFQGGPFEAEVELASVESGALEPGAMAGFLIGAGGAHVDYRLTALVHGQPGEDGGLLAVVDDKGEVQLRDFSRSAVRGGWSIDGELEEEHVPFLAPAERSGVGQTGQHEPVCLRLTIQGCAVRLRAMTSAGAPVSEALWNDVPAGSLEGSVGLVSHLGAQGGDSGFWFQDWRVAGAAVRARPARAFGPVLATQHTLSGSTLKLTAQMGPLGTGDARTARLEVRDAGERWRVAAEAELTDLSYTFPFRVNDWDGRADTPYRVVYELASREGPRETVYEGTIRAEPTGDELTVAAFTGQKCFTGGLLRWNSNNVWFPHAELVAAVRVHEPDLLYFSGDQIYEGDLVGADLPFDGDSIEDYLYKWYRWCWVFGELTRDLPAITIPDDHDVYHGNIWGAGGRRAVAGDGVTAQDSGGYKLAAPLVNAIHRTQVDHLPDPFDAAPIERGISVYTTSVEYGGVSFAVLADRMWKSSPTVAVPAGRAVNGFFRAEGFDPRASADVEGARLLGERQLAFLDRWAADWRPGIAFKVVLSQTLFANVATLPRPADTDAVTPRLGVVKVGEYPPDDVPVADADSNGWPRTARDRALRAIRKAFALHIAGDQHLGSTIRYGIDEFGDAGYALCVPSVANTWPRRWYPRDAGMNPPPGALRYAGDFFDGFGNRMTVLAVSNPVESGREPAALHDRAPGYGIVRMNTRTREIRLECWPRQADPAADEPYPGWPITIHQLANYGRAAAAWLPRLDVEGGTNPVVQVVDETSGEIVYTLRIPGRHFRPWVFAPGTYTVRVDDRVLPGLVATVDNEDVLRVVLDETASR